MEKQIPTKQDDAVTSKRKRKELNREIEINGMKIERKNEEIKTEGKKMEIKNKERRKKP